MKRENLNRLFGIADDSTKESEVIEGIVQGVNFRGPKLWILVIAVFVASLGLNTNSAAVIIGAMLISPLMGPIIGMGLAAGIYDFDLLRRSWRNYIIATLFSVLTATFYFLITPVSQAQSELLARTSPTIYDVLIALCGGLAGIIALGSRSQRTGNVIPGVAIATALMPPLCTVGFGLATMNWNYALGALFLFIINTIFIALATLLGSVFIMKFKKKTFLDSAKEKRVKRSIITLVVLTIIPAVLLTIGMVAENNFKLRVSHFIKNEMNFPMAHVISHTEDFKKKTFDVVLIGSEVDSLSLKEVEERLKIYDLDEVKMNVIQGNYTSETNDLREILNNNTDERHRTEAIIAQQQQQLTETEGKLQEYTGMRELASQVLTELNVLVPDLESVSLARGTTALNDSVYGMVTAIVKVNAKLDDNTVGRLTEWLRQRIGEDNVNVVFQTQKAKEGKKK
ncbi:MAG: TIGR00341 family protein [Bacteroidaceae bacterium]|nr:TIGR00341 family protein [Bacteroidaceae bacterium]